MVYRILIAMIFLVRAVPALSQWENVAPNLLNNFSGRSWAEGAMIFEDGMLWVGRTTLWVSPDTGRTWIRSKDGFQGSILEICAYDRNTCIFSTNRGELYITKDAGSTWQLLATFSGIIQTIAFFDNPRHIIAFEGGNAHITHDGGATWTPKPTFFETLDCKWMGGGVLYFSTGIVTTKRGSISISTDHGETWRQTPGTYDYDSYSFEVSSCKPGYIFVVNEDYLDPSDQVSCIFRSTDTGATWQPIASRNRYLDFFCGSISASRLALFAQTHLSGVMRSTDDGLTWISIGGPNGDFDTRLVTAINSNIVFAVDQSDGSVYRTLNSGGDSLDDNGLEPIPLSLSASTLFEQDTVEHCDSTRVLPLIIRQRECTTPLVKSESITGNASVDYTILTSLPPALSGSDTVRIEFDPSTNGPRNAVYEIAFADGRIIRVDLLGTGSGMDTVLYTPHAPLDFDTLYLCDQPTLRSIYLSYIGCNGRKKISESVEGSQDFSIAAAAPDSLGSSEVVRISFKPSTDGPKTATYILTLTNGDVITVPLLGYGKSSEQVTIVTADQQYDTLGVTIFVPISITGLEKATAIELTLHYDTKLEYIRSRTTSGASLDVAGQQFPGKARIFIPSDQVSLTGISGYAEFTLTADTLFTPKVWFDSLTIQGGTMPCVTNAPAVVSQIHLPQGCDFSMIANFFYHGTPPSFSIAPNPTPGSFSIASDRTIDEGRIQVFNVVGKLVFKKPFNIIKAMPHRFDLTVVPNGYYRVVISTPFGTWSQAITVQK